MQSGYIFTRTDESCSKHENIGTEHNKETNIKFKKRTEVLKEIYLEHHLYKGIKNQNLLQIENLQPVKP